MRIELALMEGVTTYIYRQFPLEELIVHARVREDFYNGAARIEVLSLLI